MTHTLLFVDDEKGVRNALRRLFRATGHRVLTASGGEEALEILRKQPVSVIVSDQNMPGMRGAELLKKTRELQPQAVRVMLTGLADVQVAMEAINDGRVYRFFPKPWNDAALLAVVEEALATIDLRREHQELQQQIREVQLREKTLSSVTQLAAVTAHQILNPLGFVRFNLSTLSEYTGDLLKEAVGREEPCNPEQVAAPSRGTGGLDLSQIQEDLPPLLTETEQGLERIADITNRLLSFSRCGVHPQVKERGLEQIVRDTMAGDLPIATDDHLIDLEAPGDSLPILCDPDQIGVALHGVVENAIEATGDRGVVTARVATDGEHASVEIADDGEGMDQATMDRAFEPFFTTRTEAGKLGMGLTVARQLVQLNGGTIGIRPGEHQGTTVTVRFPLAPAGGA